MWHQNKITTLLNIDYPIIQAGMAGGITTPHLVASVSNSGSLGNIGAGYMSAEELRMSIKKVRELTDKPFGVNLFVPSNNRVSESEINRADELLKPFRENLSIDALPVISSESEDLLFEEQIKVLIEEKIRVCSFTFGIPSISIMEKLKGAGMIVIGTATTVEEAVLNEQKGCDIVVAQGSEAGGHRGTFIGSFEDAMIGSMALIPQVVDHVNIPVIAAGGIMDARAILSSLLLGAEAVQMGTAFVTCTESGAHHLHKKSILKSTENKSVMTSAFSGKPARGVRNDFITYMAVHEDELPDYPYQNTLTQSIRSEASKQGLSDWMSLWCGQNPRLSKSESASNFISHLLVDINNIIKSKISMW